MTFLLHLSPVSHGPVHDGLGGSFSPHSLMGRDVEGRSVSYSKPRTAVLQHTAHTLPDLFLFPAAISAHLCSFLLATQWNQAPECSFTLLSLPASFPTSSSACSCFPSVSPNSWREREPQEGCDHENGVAWGRVQQIWL